ncbi:MAG: histidine triad nucleotide-binding protein [Succinivibrio sp.]
MSEETLFTKIINGEIPSTTVYSDDLVTAFLDINPRAEHHVLIVTKKPIPSVSHVEPEDEQMLGRLFIVARKLAEKYGVEKSGYRLIVNCGKDGMQEVPHIHMHFLAGGNLGLAGFPVKK